MDIKSLSKHAYDHIRARIFSRAFAPGQKLPEVQLSEDLKISRTPIREAFQMLAAVGLVNNVDRKGAYVTMISIDECSQTFDAREMIEHYAVELLKRRKITNLPNLEDIQKHVYASKIPSVDDSPDEKLAFFEPIATFHTKLIEATENKKIICLSESINQSLYRYQFFLLHHTPWSLSTSGGDHEKILKEIKKKNYDEAKNLLSAHFDRSKNIILSKLIDYLKGK